MARVVIIVPVAFTAVAVDVIPTRAAILTGVRSAKLVFCQRNPHRFEDLFLHTRKGLSIKYVRTQREGGRRSAYVPQ